MAVPMKNGGMKAGKVIFYVVLSGITTGIGAFFGAMIGSISQEIISICLSFAARSNALYCIRRINTRIQPIIPWKDDSTWQYDRFFNRHVCYFHIEKQKSRYFLKNTCFLKMNIVKYKHIFEKKPYERKK